MKSGVFQHARTGSVAAFISIAMSFPAFPLTATWRASTNTARWVDKGSLSSTVWSATSNYLEILPDSQFQVIEGFGGAFSETGWEAMQVLSQANRDSIIRGLFDSTGCNFTVCRTPMAGNDFSLGGWPGSYTYNENSGDYNMASFSIARDYAYLIPFIKAAMKFQPGLRLWSSPWVMPVWLQTAISAGDTKAYAAFALYAEKFVYAYRAENLRMTAVALWNEPDITGPWTSGAMHVDYVKNYWGPLFVKDKVPAEMWLGTYWNPNHLNQFITPVLSDAAAKQYLSYIGLQGCCNQNWQTVLHNSYPGMKIIETEGLAWEEPTWAGGMNNFNNIYGWLSGWTNMYMIWNMVLADFPNGSRNQGAMVHVIQASKTIDFTPTFYAVKHFSHYVKPNARHIKAVDNSGITGNKVAFRNTTGDVVLVLSNTDAASKQITIKLGDQMLQAAIPANSMCTFKINIPGAVDNTLHPVPSGLSAQAVDSKIVALRWNAASSVSHYVLYRDGAKITQTWDTLFSDRGLQELTGYSYQVSAVNWLGTEGAKSTAAGVTTPADNAPPAIVAAGADSQTSVYVIFNEPVEQASATNPANYTIAGATISATTIQSDQTTVVLTTSTLIKNHDYTLSVRNIRDRSRVNNTMANADSVKFACMKQGLMYDYYETAAGLGTALAIPAMQPLRSGIVDTIGLSMTRRADYYALRFKGFIHASTAGQYTFFTTSDDGSVLLVDSTIVVSNDGSHGMTEKSGSIQLTAGMHSIAVLFWQSNGGEGLTVAWTPAGGAKQAIPNSVLFVNSRLKTDITAADHNRPVSAGIKQDVRFDVRVDYSQQTICLDAPGPFAAALYDMKGRLLCTWSGSHEGILRMPADATAGAVYFVRITAGRETISRTILVK